MLKLIRSNQKWWQKPLAQVNDRYLPAELVVLKHSLRDGESGAWINSRGTETAVVDLLQDSNGKFRTVRAALPDFVQNTLKSFYLHPEVVKGVFDLIIWHIVERNVRFVEVKCPHWDRLTPEQQRFAEIAHDRDIETQVVEWEFGD